MADGGDSAINYTIFAFTIWLLFTFCKTFFMLPGLTLNTNLFKVLYISIFF